MKQLAYSILRYFGVYWLARKIFRNQLLILCYHGISVRDEHQWWPGVFMREAVFRRRLELLRSCGFNVLGLTEALTALDEGGLPPKSIVITADDGYINSPETLWKGCSDNGFPLTIYVTSYYAEKQNPIFNVMVQYLFWKTERSELTGDLAFAGIADRKSISLRHEKNSYWVKHIIHHGRENCTEEGRQEILRGLCDMMDLDYDSFKTDGMFMVMDGYSISKLAEQGVDIQLHTHRHRFPVERETAIQEIEDNRRFLEPLVGNHLEHFCYPSGLWDAVQHPWLSDLGIKSATTCQLGFVKNDSDRFALNRYLDRDDITESEFLAEVSGFLMFARKVKGKVTNLWR